MGGAPRKMCSCVSQGSFAVIAYKTFPVGLLWDISPSLLGTKLTFLWLGLSSAPAPSQMLEQVSTSVEICVKSQKHCFSIGQIQVL